MKSVYVGRKPCTCIAVAFDIVTLQDPKVIGALLKLSAESGLVIDRIDREEVIFYEVCPHHEQSRKADRSQLEIDFEKPADSEGGVGPAEMGEGFTCNYSGACPHENKSCADCEYAGSAIPGSAVSEDVGAGQEEEPQTETAPELVEAPETGVDPAGQVEGETLVDEMRNSAFAQWATMDPGERQAAGIEPPQELEQADVDAGDAF